MALKDLSADEKIKIAIDAIIGEVIGKTSSEIAQKYSGVSAKAVTTLKNQALEAIRTTFSEPSTLSDATGISEDAISAAIERLLGGTATGNSSIEDAEEEYTQTQAPLPVSQVVDAIMEYNDQAAKDNGQLIYISRTVVQDVASYVDKEVDEYFKAHKEEIDEHNSSHGLKRNSNRALKGLDWQSWLEF